MLTFLLTSEIKVIKSLQQLRAETHSCAREEQACPFSLLWWKYMYFSVFTFLLTSDIKVIKQYSFVSEAHGSAKEQNAGPSYQSSQDKKRSADLLTIGDPFFITLTNFSMYEKNLWTKVDKDGLATRMD